MHSAPKGEIMLDLSQQPTTMCRSRYLSTAAACALTCALAACGGGSDDSAVAGALTSAKTTVVNSDDSRSTQRAGDIKKRVTPLDPVITSNNKAMKKIARMRCEKQLTAERGDDKTHQAVSTRRTSQREACKRETVTAG